ncbi:MAG: cytidylate kinase-like family protein [Ruminococcus sp.]|nr:cytidylate kinase-like family protein [Ruminococcus sp.]
MKRKIITIERQYGSGGSIIGKIVAEKLGIKYYNREILEMTAKEKGVDPESLEEAEERVPTSILYTLFINSSQARAVESTLPLADKVFIWESNIIKRLSESEDSFVLVGRCGSYVIGEEKCFSVYIYGDMESRIKRTVEEYGVHERKAENVIKKADKRRETFHNINTGSAWMDKENYSLCLNSSQLSDELCADIIVKAFNEYNRE